MGYGHDGNRDAGYEHGSDMAVELSNVSASWEKMSAERKQVYHSPCLDVYLHVTSFDK